MVNSLLRNIVAVIALSAVLLPAQASCCDILPCDTTLVFKKMPADTAVIKKVEKPKKKPVKKAAAKKGGAQKRVLESKPKAKSKSDSVVYMQPKYSLGDRIIMRGDSGADVKKLAEIMVKNLYLDENSVPYTKGGAVLYDGELLRAVKLFQKVSGLYDDGIVGATTIKELRKIHRWRRTSN